MTAVSERTPHAAAMAASSAPGVVASPAHATRLPALRSRAGTDAPTRRVPPYTLLAHRYDRLLGDAGFVALWPMLLQALERFDAPPTHAADLGCGTGRFAEGLARRGIAVFAVDRSPAMLSRARRRLDGLPATLLRQDLRRLSLPRPVQLAVCAFDTLNYLLRPQELDDALARIAAALEPGGLLVCDWITGAGATAAAARRRLPDAHGRWTSACRTWPERRLSRVDYRWHPLRPEAVPYRETHWQRWYPLDEMRAAWVRCGFEPLLLRAPDAASGGESFWMQALLRRGDAVVPTTTPVAG